MVTKKIVIDFLATDYFIIRWQFIELTSLNFATRTKRFYGQQLRFDKLNVTNCNFLDLGFADTAAVSWTLALGLGEARLNPLWARLAVGWIPFLRYFLVMFCTAALIHFFAVFKALSTNGGKKRLSFSSLCVCLPSSCRGK